MNNQDLKHHIIKTLHDSTGHPLGEDVLIAQAKSRVRPMPSNDTVKQAIADLSKASLITSMVNDLDETNPFWLLDEKGQAYATRQRL